MQHNTSCCLVRMYLLYKPLTTISFTGKTRSTHWVWHLCLNCTRQGTLPTFSDAVQYVGMHYVIHCRKQLRLVLMVGNKHLINFMASVFIHKFCWQLQLMFWSVLVCKYTMMNHHFFVSLWYQHFQNISVVIIHQLQEQRQW